MLGVRRRLLLCCLGVLAGVSAKMRLQAEEKEAPRVDRVNAAPLVALVVGTHHYAPQKTLPLFAEELQRHGFRTVVIAEEGDPEEKRGRVLPSLAKLQEADLAILYLRHLVLPDEEWCMLMDYVRSGKPILGLRTSNHATKYEEGHARWHWNVDFGKKVLGGPYLAHQGGKTKISVIEERLGHPVLMHLPKQRWVSPGSLYLTRLEKGCVPLVLGVGKGRPRVVERDFGVFSIHREESDIVAWTYENEWGGKVFATSFGHEGDFAEPSVVRMFLNASCWLTNRPVPAADTEIGTWQVEYEK